MSVMMKFAFTMTFAAAAIMSCYGQLSFHNDANTNSFTVKAPGSQQSFTRYFGGQQGALLHQQQLTAQSSQLQQQYAQAPVNQAELQQALQAAYYNQQRYQQTAAASEQQSQYISPQDYAAFLQPQQQLQQQQQQQQYFASPQEQQSTAASQQALNYAAQEQQANLLGVAYSPSTQVSHVKFSNGGGLAYNF